MRPADMNKQWEGIAGLCPPQSHPPGPEMAENRDQATWPAPCIPFRRTHWYPPMEIASLAATPKTPAPAAEPAPQGDGKSFADRLDEQVAARRARHAPKTEAKQAVASTTPATPAPVTDQAAATQTVQKGDNPGQALPQDADTLAIEKAATDAATDPSAVLLQMLQHLTTPTPPPRETPAPAGTVAPVPAPAGPDAREAIESAAGETAASAAEKPVEEAPGLETPPGPSPETSTSQSAAPPADLSPPTQAAAGTGGPQPTSTPVVHGHETAPRAAPVPLEPQALGLSIMKHAEAGERVFEISLTPDELGRVDVRLEFADDGRLTAHVYAERPETLALLERDRSELARVLSAQGMTSDNASLNFALRDERGTPDQGNEGGNRRPRGRATAVAQPLDTATATPDRSRTGNGAIDLQV